MDFRNIFYESDVLFLLCVCRSKENKHVLGWVASGKCLTAMNNIMMHSSV